MALTAAEKMRRHRQKLKDQGKYEDYKNKHKENVKKYRRRKIIKQSKLKKEVRENLKSEEKRKTRERVAKHRALKKARNENEIPQAYRSAKSLGKATSRVKKSLPTSPRKKIMVVRKLFETYVGETSSQESSENKSNSLALRPQTVETVQAFYERDDVSRQAPGLKDVTTVKENGLKQKIQTRHLYSSIRETHALFTSEFEEIKIGKSKFSELRPLHVKVSSKLPQNVCLCKYHENFILGIKALHNAVPVFPKYIESFWNKFLCDPQTDNCWLGKCNQCNNTFKTELNDLLTEHGPITCKWFVWSDENGVLQKIAREETLEELVEYLTSIEEKFKEHVFTKRVQSKSYQSDRTITLECKNENDKKIALVQVDFSENYTCIAQDEVQSYHWQQPQVSLFTSSICYDGKQHPIVIVSDNTDHTKDTVIAYMSRLFEELPAHIKEVRVWSDGPSSQFKNKYIAASLKHLEEKHCIMIKWNYFATSHGKGPVDGIGGSVKRQVRQAVLCRKDHVFNAADFCRVAKLESKVKIIHLTSEDIDSINKNLDTKTIFEECEKVPGISKVHAMMNKGSSMKYFFLTKDMKKPKQCAQNQPMPSTSSEGHDRPIAKRRPVYNLIYDSSDDSSDVDDPPGDCSQVSQYVKKGSFVLVEFTHEKKSCLKYKYVAVCQSDEDENSDVKVMCLKRVSTNNNRLFKMDENDTTFVNANQILTILSCPEIEMKGDRMYYKFKKPVDVKEK